MDDLGKHLKTERKKQKLSIEEVGSHTKIPVRFIQAIEANQFSQIPNAVSAKGFLRSYAQFLNLDTTEISESFDEKLHVTKGVSPLENQDEILSYLQVKRPSRLPFPRRVILLVGGVVLLLLIFVSLLPEREKPLRTAPLPLSPDNQIATMEDKLATDEILIEETQVRETPTKSDKIFSASSQEDAIIPGNTVLTKENILSTKKVRIEKKEEPSTLSESENEAKIKTPIITSSEEEPTLHLLQVEALETTWVQVKIDGDKTREALLQPNDKIRWKAKEKFLLKVGNAGGVKISLNGKDLPPLGPNGEVAEKEIFGPTQKTE